MSAAQPAPKVAQHTPGKWNIITRPDGTIWIQGEPNGDGWREVCSLPVFPSMHGTPRELANARLIAAAPALLAALEELTEQHDAMLATFPAGFGWGRLISDKARAAIAQAKGQS